MNYEKEVIAEATKSPCNKRKVGAIIVNKEGDIISRGHNYNKNSSNCEDADGNTLDGVVHAEIAAIQGPMGFDNPTKIYVNHPPCKNCGEAIAALGMEIIVINTFMKFDTDKLRYNLVPPVALKALAQVLTYGAKKYKPNNWKNVDDIDRYIDALYRHLESWRGGEKLDKDSGLSHLAHALTNITFLIYKEEL